LTVGLVTCGAVPELTRDDQILVAELARRGIAAVTLLWDDRTVAWERFDALVLRSCWDYHLRTQEFVAWLGRIEDSGARLWNPAPLVRRNLHKSYLRILSEAGVPIPPTIWLERETRPSLTELLTERAWSEAVIKPAVSASAHRTWRARLADAPRLQPRLDAALAEGDVLVQRFEPAIRERGEWSLVFFGGRFSHGVIKRPRSDDFRVQEEHGGTAQPAVAPPDLVRQGRRILDEIEGPWLYARVDGIESDGVFTLLELELIEPVLFLAQDPQAAARFAEALETLLCRSEEARPPRIAGNSATVDSEAAGETFDPESKR
jgi:glutathione synthase/RimK-type ligase-like ATP-grasp enzyme